MSQSENQHKFGARIAVNSRGLYSHDSWGSLCLNFIYIASSIYLFERQGMSERSKEKASLRLANPPLHPGSCQTKPEDLNLILASPVGVRESGAGAITCYLLAGCQQAAGSGAES